MEYWFINTKWLRVKRFIKNKENKHKFFDNKFIDFGKIVGLLGQQTSVMTTREELKIDNAREEWKKFIAQSFR